MPDCKFLLVSAGICTLTTDLVLLATFQELCTLNYLMVCEPPISCDLSLWNIEAACKLLLSKSFSHNWKETPVCMSVAISKEICIGG
jgi:hypothetical protein